MQAVGLDWFLWLVAVDGLWVFGTVVLLPYQFLISFEFCRLVASFVV